MRSIVSKILILIYLLIVIVLSLYLFMYNPLGLNINKKYTMFTSENLNSFKDNELIIVKNNSNIKINDQILFYNFYTNRIKILEGKVVSLEKTNKQEVTYELDNKRFVSNSYVIGKINNTKSIPLIGFIFKYLTSTWGYLLFALIPTMILFVYQLNNFLKPTILGGVNYDKKD